jgi:flagellin-like hook-associated protein FlgL
MTTPSPLVLINGSPQANGINVARGSTVTVTLASNAGVYAWDLVCIGTDELSSVSTVNASVNINHAINSATFTMPDGYGSAVIFRSVVNNGVDINGVVQTNYSTTFGVYVVGTDGTTRVGAQNETIEGDASFGWVSKFNPFLRNLPTIFSHMIANVVKPASGYTLQPYDFFIGPNNISGAVTLYLPITPPEGTTYIIADINYAAGANHISINTNGSTIDGSAGPYALITNNSVVAVTYLSLMSAAPGWKIIFKV